MKISPVCAIGSAVSALVALGFAPTAGADVDGEFVTTESRDMRCVLKDGSVSCQGSFRNTPTEGGRVYNIVSTDQLSGSLTWSAANIASTGDSAPANDTVLTYGQPFHIDGWTIVSSPTGTRFTEDGTDRGVSVSLDRVVAF